MDNSQEQKDIKENAIEIAEPHEIITEEQAELKDTKISSKDPATEESDNVKELKAQLLGAMAESENMRRRFEKQLEDTARFAINDFAKNIIAVIDNLYRAEATINTNQGDDKAKQFDLLVSGINLTLKDLTSCLEKHGIVRIAPNQGDDFDHNYHQAVAHIATSEMLPGKIFQVMQDGYRIYDRLLRAAMVSVSKSE